MGTFDQFQRKRAPASTSTLSAPGLLRPSRQFALLSASPSEQEPHVGRVQPGHARPLEYSFDRIPIFPAKKNDTGLPDTLKAGVENLSGMSIDDVRVHYHSPKPAEVEALAYTQGINIHVGPGQEHHLPHEAWHIVQQKQERVRPTLHTMGVAINDDSALEGEADEMGARAKMQGTPKINLPRAGSSPVKYLGVDAGQESKLPGTLPLQRVTIKDWDKVVAAILKRLKKFKLSGKITARGLDADKQAIWETLTQIAGDRLEKMTPEDAADAYLTEKQKELGGSARPDQKSPAFSYKEGMAEKQKELGGSESPRQKSQVYSYKEGMELREPPPLFNEKMEKINGKAIDFQIPGLGVARIALYKSVNQISYKGMLAWMSHGLQVSNNTKSAKKERSFGAVVGHNENLLRPETAGGFDPLLHDFEKQRGRNIPRASSVPDLIVGSHDPDIDFPKEHARQAIGSMVSFCDAAILVDFVRFEKVDQQYQTLEMEYLGFQYVPLEVILAHLPEELQSYSDFLMLCCRTDISEKMKGRGASQGKSKVQSFTLPPGNE